MIKSGLLQRCDVFKYVIGMSPLINFDKEQGKTILICSNSAKDIFVLCDTVHEMDKGYITQIKSRRTQTLKV